MNAPRSALISVFDKSGLEPLAQTFQALGIRMISSGGTHMHLTDLGFQVDEVSDLTQFPEILDGRVKTLHPAIHGGLLAVRESIEHMATIDTHRIAPIDILISNLYPFEQTRDSGAGFDDCIENIDVGGPAMIRAAAKNHAGVLVITGTGDYPELIERLKDSATIDDHYRRRLAQKAFTHTAAYDSAVSNWLAGQNNDPLPETFTLAATRKQHLRYGENPHQAAAFYQTEATALAAAELLQGKALSYNNIVDADAAWSLVQEFGEPAVAIIKHANPCGCAVRSAILDAYQAALEADPVSAFGGIVATNRPLDQPAAEAITRIFTEVVIAPGIDDAARAVFAQKPNLRLIKMPAAATRSTQIKSVAGGLLVQDPDDLAIEIENFKLASKREPSAAEMRDMIFAFKVARHVKSNAIVLARDGAVIGVGAGQMSRIDSVQIAASRAKARGLQGPCVLASDAFFPFADGLERAVDAGITAAIQPGGSMRDDDVIAFADRAKLAMIMTGQRHFWH